jgi:hypothetical protein
MSNAARKPSRRFALRNLGHLAAGGSLLAAGVGTTVALAPSGGADPVPVPMTFTVTDLSSSGSGSLAQALIDANDNPGYDTVEFAAGLTGTIRLASSLPVITEGVTITGPGADLLTVSGNGLYSIFAVNNYNPDIPMGVVISGLGIADGAQAAGGPLSLSPGVSALNSSLTLRDVDIHDNVQNDPTVFVFGASAVSRFGKGDLVITDSAIHDNLSGPSSVFSSAVTAITGKTTIRNSSITDNDSDTGGGVFAFGSSSPTDDDATQVEISSSVISGNQTRAGWGGVLAVGVTVDVRDSVISDNHSIDSDYSSIYTTGGAILFGSVSATISNTTISDNTSGGVGGLVMGSQFVSSTEADANIVIDRVTVTGNVGGSTPFPVGGIEIRGNAVLSSSTISGNSGSGVNVVNQATSYTSTLDADSLSGLSRMSTRSRLLSILTGGAHSSPSATGPTPSQVSIDNTTIADNGGVGLGSLEWDTRYSDRDDLPVRLPIITIRHSLLAGNRGQDVNTPASIAWSLIEQQPTVTLTGSDHNLVGVDPELQPLESVSPTVSVRPILFGSRAWNAGDPSFVPPPATDQRGLPRVIEIIDMGAFEVQDRTFIPAPVVPTFAG